MALCALAQWCLPVVHEMQGEALSWLEACDDAAKVWAGILLDKVAFIDRVNYFTAQ